MIDLLKIIKICSLINSNLVKVIKDIQSDSKNKIFIDNSRLYYNDFYIDFNKTNKKPPNNAVLIRTGKVRNIFKYLNDDSKLLLAVTDRVSSFDRNLCDIPYKGKVLNSISTYWFNITRHIIDNHMIKSYDNIMIVKRCTVIPIEFVVRGFISKSRTETSLYHNYKEGNRNYCGLNFADDLEANEELNQIIFTPTTKGKHDELITFDEIIKKNILNKKDLIFCKKNQLNYFYMLKIYLKNEDYFLPIPN
jgi:phosphoribosylaminoimidazole-succinocarboxamide synthase